MNGTFCEKCGEKVYSNTFVCDFAIICGSCSTKELLGIDQEKTKPNLELLKDLGIDPKDGNIGEQFQKKVRELKDQLQKTVDKNYEEMGKYHFKGKE